MVDPKIIITVLTKLPEVRRAVWEKGFLKRRLIKYYAGEGFKINSEIVADIAQSGKALNGTSNETEVQEKAAFLCALTMQLRELNAIHDKALKDDNYDELYKAILLSCDLRGPAGYQKVVTFVKDKAAKIKK